VTLWGVGKAASLGGPGNIHDYASKQWAGLVAQVASTTRLYN
jgi:hypothetical protein